MKKYITILACLFSLYSCEEDKEGSTFIYTGQAFYMLDKDGNDLLDPNNKNAIDPSKIKIYHLIDGKKQMSFTEVTKPWSDPSNPTSSPQIKYYNLGIRLNSHGKDGSISETYIEWNENDVDTIYSKIVRKRNYLLVETIKVNDSIWSPKNESIQDDIFTFIK